MLSLRRQIVRSEIPWDLTQPLPPVCLPYILNSLDLAERWVEVFGKDKLIVRPFEREQLKDGGVVKDCMKLLDMQCYFEISKVRNTRDSRECVKFIELLYDHLPRFVDTKANSSHRDVGELVKSLVPGETYEYPELYKYHAE